MSRSKWAWTEGCAPVGVVACGVGERAARGPARRSLFHETPSQIDGGKHVRHRPRAGPSAGRVRERLARQDPTPNKQYSTHVDRASAVVLALGSGYSSRGGAARVRTLQRRLAGTGFASGPIDGRYGPRTEQAVRSFQAAHGLGVDGIAGPLTLAALSRPSVALYPGAGYAGRGSARVRVLQRRLAGAGFASGPIDGRYGPRTEQAVRSFQAAHGLGVDGIAGATNPGAATKPTTHTPPAHSPHPPRTYGRLAAAHPPAANACPRNQEDRAGEPFNQLATTRSAGAACRARRGPRALSDAAWPPTARAALRERRSRGNQRCSAQ